MAVSAPGDHPGALSRFSPVGTRMARLTEQVVEPLTGTSPPGEPMKVAA